MLRFDVIVKVHRVTDDPVAMERFRREAAVMARLRHPSIVSLYRFYEGNPAALVMEYVRGQTLAARVNENGFLPAQQTAEIVDSIAAALDSAHAQEIIHRDVKPANILLPKRGPARLTDFGVAHIDDNAPLTLMGDVLGTIEYASPEQVRGQEAPDARSDVYSLAAVTYFTLTGTPPFRAADESTQAQLSVMHRQVFAEPPPLRFHQESVSPDVEAVVLRGLAKAPGERYQSAGQFAAALRAAAAAENGTPQEHLRVSASRRTGALAGALAASALILVGGVLLWKAHLSESADPAAFPPASAALLPVRPVLHSPAAQSASPRTRSSRASRRAAARKRRADAANAAVRVKRPDMRPELRALEMPSAAPSPSARSASSAAAVPVRPMVPAQGWLRVYAHQNIAPLGEPVRLAEIRPQAILVDGHPVPGLKAGGWVSLPVGHHTVSFIPNARSGYAGRHRVSVVVKPQSRLSKQVLLPIRTPAAKREAPAVAPVASTRPPHLLSPLAEPDFLAPASKPGP